jgi:peptidoglycan/LPS O-acetylase OafA/YrhL
MMKCTNCTKLIPDAANFCGYCGHQLKNVTQSPAVTAMRQENVGGKIASTGMPIERILKIISIVLMVVSTGYALYGAIYVILYVWAPFLNHVLNFLPPLTIIGMIFVVRKQPLIAAAALVTLAVASFSNYLFSIPAIVAAVLLSIVGLMPLWKKKV